MQLTSLHPLILGAFAMQLPNAIVSLTMSFLLPSRNSVIPTEWILLKCRIREFCCPQISICVPIEQLRERERAHENPCTFMIVSGRC